jgi:Tol biopolymer transport system component
MPDVQEVFRLATQKIDPEQGFVERQHHHQRRRTRNRKLGALALAAVIGLVALVAVIRAADDGTGTWPAVEPTPTPPAGTAPETAYLIDLNTGEMTPLPKSIAGGGYAVSPDGTMVAYTSGDDAGNSQVFIASLDGTDVQQVTHDQRWAGEPDWSPDGAAIAYTSASVFAGPHYTGDGNISNIFVLDLATGETWQVTNEKPTTETCLGCGTLGAVSPQFSPDGTSIVYEVSRAVPVLGSANPLAVPRVSVRIVPVTGGKSVLLVGRAAGGTLSPDGSTLAVGCGFGGGLCIAHADGTNLRVLVSGRSLVPKWSPDGTRIAYINLDNKVFVVDVATGETTFVAEGTWPDWLDNHTLIIEGRGQ